MQNISEFLLDIDLKRLDRLRQFLNLATLFPYPIIDMTNLSASASA